MNVHYDKDCTGIEPSLLFAAEELSQKKAITRPHSFYIKRNSGKYTYRRPDGAKKNHEWAVKTQVLIEYLNLNFDVAQNDDLNQTLVILAELHCMLKASCPLVVPGPAGGVPSVGGF